MVMEQNKLYKCQLHTSNEGFFSESGEWICWICWLNNPLNDPKGRVIDEIKTKKHYLRIVDRSMFGQSIGVELYDLSTKNRYCMFANNYRDLSVALRKFKYLFKLVKQGKVNKKNIRRFDPHSPFSYRSMARVERESRINIQLPTHSFLNPIRDVVNHLERREEEDRREPTGIREISEETYTEQLVVGNDNTVYRRCVFDRSTVANAIIEDSLLLNAIIQNSTISNSELRNCNWEVSTLEGCRVVNDE